MTNTITKDNKNQELVILDKNEQIEIQEAFDKAQDFRTIWERITAPLDAIVEQTAAVIDNDPIMNVSWALEWMNSDVQKVYSEIIDNDWSIMKFFKSVPIIWMLAQTLDAKFDSASFDMKGVTWKIEAIFSGFDITYNSVNKSIDLQKAYLDWIEANMWKVLAYKQYIDQAIINFTNRIEETKDQDEKTKMQLFIRNVEFFQGNLVVLLWNLEIAKKRLLMRLDSANKLSLAMSSSRPIFKVLLSTAIIEVSSQKAIDASIKAMEAMWATIDKMSVDLTDKAIESSRKAEERTSAPILSSTVFIDNVAKLKTHFEEIEAYRARIYEESKAERKAFNDARIKLESIKLLNKTDTEELNKILEKAKV